MLKKSQKKIEKKEKGANESLLKLAIFLSNTTILFRNWFKREVTTYNWVTTNKFD